MIDALTTLLARCKCGVFLIVNEHRDYYDTVEHAIQEYREMSCPPIGAFTQEIIEGIIRTGNIIDLQFYPNTPIGSTHIIHYDLEKILKMAHDCLKNTS
jgi:hypothetical protein